MVTPQTLSAKQTRFVAEYLQDSNGAAAAVRAGYAPGSAKVTASRMLTKDNPVRRAIQARQAAEADRLGLRRQDVLAGLLEAADMAKIMSDPSGMVCAWKQVGLLMGYYTPERVRVDVKVGVVGQAELARMNQCSDAELVQIIAAGV